MRPLLQTAKQPCSCDVCDRVIEEEGEFFQGTDDSGDPDGELLCVECADKDRAAQSDLPDYDYDFEET